jgi:demethylmenaquinone methyltransferase / 2-methoxy-6-polyprenyl-1,4-benzoquinol methylase
MSDKKNQVKQMFDSIAKRYDFLNHFLSAGVDYYWRKAALNMTYFPDNAVLLDVACGTGDFANEAHKRGVLNVFGADLSLPMLSLFDKKAVWIQGKLVQMAAEQIPFKTGSFTNITVAFGVRNFYNIPEAFQAFFYILKPAGAVTILEFCMPKNPVIKVLYRFYFKNILPLLGRVISGDPGAYTYLPESVEEFDSQIDLVHLLKAAGFGNVQRKDLTFGLVQVVVAQK